MIVSSAASYGTSGRMIGGYVYMLVCHDSEKIYIKVGKSIAPMKRLDQLRHACPVTPRYFYVCPLPTNKIARKIEAELHCAFEAWRHNGEWYKLEAKDKADFNAAWRHIFNWFSTALWKLSWTKLNVRPLAAAARSKAGLFKKRYRDQFRLGGRVYEDCLRQSQN